jgi:hypothetical protein
MSYFEVKARYAHGTRAEVVSAINASEALAKAKPALRKMIPSGYRVLSWAVIAA